MSKLSKAVALASVGVAAMAVSGAGMAAGTALPGLFSIDNNLTVVGGDVSADCPVGSTCQVLEGTGDGMLLRSIDDGNGNAYIQTIIAENLAGGGLYANEQTVQQGLVGAQNATNIAQKMIIDDVAQGFNASHVMVGDGYVVGTPSAPDLHFVLSQTLDMGNGAISKARIQGAITGAGGDVNEQGGTGRKVYLDQLGGVNEPEMGDFVYRWDNTPASHQNLDLEAGVGGAVVSTGATNTNIGALFIHQAVTGMDNDFGYLKFGTGITNAGTSGGTWTEPLVSLNVIAGNPNSNITPNAGDPATGYDSWGAGSTAEAVFGALGDTTDFDTTSFMP